MSLPGKDDPDDQSEATEARVSSEPVSTTSKRTVSSTPRCCSDHAPEAMPPRQATGISHSS